VKAAHPDEFGVPGLVYVTDALPGITRRRRGRGFGYATSGGEPVSLEARTRIAGLGIPPAWTDVWICADPAGHLQATGIDAAGRKQYRYHAAWSAWRSQAKYDTLTAFGAALGRFRAKIARDLEGRAGDLDFSLAAMAVLLDRLNLRVGSAAHTAAHRTYGASTLLRRHLRLDEGMLTLRFKAKGGRAVTHTLRDKRLHRIFEAIDDLPGRRLFTWIDAEGAVHPVSSQHMNAYLQQGTGLGEVSAKTFRTWAGTLAAFDAARAEPGRLTIRALAEAAAARLCNTPAIARASYIHTRVLDLAGMEGAARLSLLRAIPPAGSGRLRANERRLLGFLRQAG
jgi:DNA topoisomerase-1